MVLRVYPPVAAPLTRIFPPGFRNEGFDVRDAAGQRCRHPLAAIRGHQHIVFNPDANALVLFERGPDCGDELFISLRLRQIVQRVGPNINSWLVREDHPSLQRGAATHVMHIHSQPM